MSGAIIHKGKPIRVWWDGNLRVWIASCKCGYRANGLTAGSAITNVLTLYKRDLARMRMSK